MDSLLTIKCNLLCLTCRCISEFYCDKMCFAPTKCMQIKIRLVMLIYFLYIDVFCLCVCVKVMFNKSKRLFF